MLRLLIFAAMFTLAACTGQSSVGNSTNSVVNTVVTSALRIGILLPTHSGLATHHRSTPSAPATKETTTAPDTLTVLHIEDNPDDIRLMRHMFTALQNLNLLHSHTGELGIKLATANPPALILLDMALPGVNGTVVLHRLRNHPVTRDIPVVAMITNSSALGATLSLSGFNDYLAKPVDVARLQAVLNRQLTDLHKTPRESATIVKQ